MPNAPNTLKERAYAYIRERMLVGTIPPGDRVSDVEIARELGISRTPVREAIVQLEAQGLIEQQPGLGPRVRRLDRRELEESFELREMLECGAAEIAATRISADELSSLDGLLGQYQALVRRLRDGEDPDPAAPVAGQLNVLDMAFHLKIIGAAKNRALSRVVGELHLLTRILRRRANHPRISLLQRLDRIASDHRRILRALRGRDGAAAREALRRHLRWAAGFHLEAFDWEERQRSSPDGAPDDVDFPLSVLDLLREMERRGDARGGAP